MPRFTLRQIFIAIVALAAGLAITRLANGRWLDVPLAVLSFYFVLSLCRQAAATRRTLIEQADLSREERWGGRVLVAVLLSTAVVLVGAWVGTFLAAAGLFPIAQEDDFLHYKLFPLLPQDLVGLAMLVAIGLGSWQRWQPKATPPRQQVFSALAAGVTLILILVYWADRVLIWFLIYVSISGVEAAQSPKSLPPEMAVSGVLRMQRFALGGIVGLSIVVVNAGLIAALVIWWNRPRPRWTLLILLAVGLAAECGCAGWIAGPGLRQLSPPMQEAVRFPPLRHALLATTMALLAVAVFSWRMLAKAVPVDRSSQSLARPFYLHERWLGCLLLGVVAASEAAMLVVAFVSESLGWGGSFDWELIGFGLTYRPANFIWLAAAAAGFSLAWIHWRRRNQPFEDLLPCVNPAQFAVLTFSMLIAVVASAPILAAVSFSYWFVHAEIF